MSLQKSEQALSILKRELILNPNDADRLLSVFMNGIYKIAFKDGFNEGVLDAKLKQELSWLLERQEQ